MRLKVLIPNAKRTTSVMLVVVAERKARSARHQYHRKSERHFLLARKHTRDGDHDRMMPHADSGGTKRVRCCRWPHTGKRPLSQKSLTKSSPRKCLSRRHRQDRPCLIRQVPFTLSASGLTHVNLPTKKEAHKTRCSLYERLWKQPNECEKKKRG